MPNPALPRDPETDDLAGLLSDLGKLLFAFLIFPASWLVLSACVADAIKGGF